MSVVVAASPQATSLDARVRKFLDDHRYGWRDLNVPEADGRALHDLVVKNGYKRALEIANSPNVGMCLCVGCWLEGGKTMGKGPVETIRYFAAQRKLFKVHFRNVNQPLPHFVETFIDNGYMNMYLVMKALCEVDFRGVAIADHVPSMGGHHNVGWAYSIAYMKAMLDRANAEVGARAAG
jgi:mannonate dehydratase